MAAYMVCTMKIHDPVTFRKYSDHTPKTLEKYGGRFLTRGDAGDDVGRRDVHGADGHPRISRSSVGGSAGTTTRNINDCRSSGARRPRTVE